MKKIIWIIVITALAAGAYFAYDRIFSTDPLTKSIPSDAALVFAVDMKSIAEKAGGDKLKDMNMMKRMREELTKEKNDPISSAINELIDDPLKSGINFLNRAYMFVEFKESKPVVGFVCGVLSSSALEEMIKKFPVKTPIEEHDNIKTLAFGPMGMMGWNSKELIVLGGPEMKVTPEIMKSYFTHDAPSVSSLSDFKKFNSTKFDAGVFINYGALMSMSKLSGASALMGDLYNDTYADLTTVFEDNSIVTNMHYYINNKETEKKLMMVNDHGISADHLKLISDKHVYGLMALSFDPKKFMELLEINPLVSGVIVEMAQQVGVSKDELTDLLTGDISIALTDVRNNISTKMKYDYDQKTGAMTTSEVADTSMSPMFTATVGIKTDATFEKIMKKTGMQKEGPYYEIKLPGAHMYLVENKVGVTLTNDKIIADEMVSKKELTEIGEPAKSIVKDNPAGFYMDLDLKSYPVEFRSFVQEKMGTDNFNAFSKTLAVFNDMEVKAKKLNGVFELKLKPGSGNSLNRIVDAIDKNVYPLIAAESEKREQKYSNQALQDSIVAAAIQEATQNKK